MKPQIPIFLRSTSGIGLIQRFADLTRRGTRLVRGVISIDRDVTAQASRGTRNYCQLEVSIASNSELVQGG